jgi:hypothetical protein
MVSELGVAVISAPDYLEPGESRKECYFDFRIGSLSLAVLYLVA